MKHKDQMDARIGDQLFHDIQKALEPSTAHLAKGPSPDSLVREVFRRWHSQRPKDFDRVARRWLNHLNQQRLQLPNWMCAPLPRVWQERHWWQRRKLLHFDSITIAWDQWVLAATLMMTEGQAVRIKRLHRQRQEEHDRRGQTSRIR